MGALDRNALFSRTLAPTFHGKLLPPRSHSCSIGSWMIGRLDASEQFRPFGRVAGTTNPETNLGGQAVRPACAAVQPSISTERTWLRWTFVPNWGRAWGLVPMRDWGERSEARLALKWCFCAELAW